MVLQIPCTQGCDFNSSGSWEYFCWNSNYSLSSFEKRYGIHLKKKINPLYQYRSCFVPSLVEFALIAMKLGKLCRLLHFYFIFTKIVFCRSVYVWNWPCGSGEVYRRTNGQCTTSYPKSSIEFSARVSYNPEISKNQLH